MHLRALDLHSELKQEMLHEFKLFLQDLHQELKQSVTNQTHAVKAIATNIIINPGATSAGFIITSSLI